MKCRAVTNAPRLRQTQLSNRLYSGAGVCEGCLSHQQSGLDVKATHTHKLGVSPHNSKAPTARQEVRGVDQACCLEMDRSGIGPASNGKGSPMPAE